MIERARLSLEPRPRLVAVPAPAGYGKTSLLAQWQAGLAARGVASGWLTQDEGDNQAGA